MHVRTARVQGMAIGSKGLQHGKLVSASLSADPNATNVICCVYLCFT